MTGYLVFVIMYENNNPYIDYMNYNLYLPLEDIIERALELKKYADEIYIVAINADIPELIDLLKERAIKI